VAWSSPGWRSSRDRRPHRLVLRDFDRDTARRAASTSPIFPTTFFFFAPFTEALFLAASVWAIYAARMRGGRLPESQRSWPD
jgi:hypothetical protein